MAKKTKQFVKIPHKLIKDLDGTAIKIYCKLLKHCHGKKTTCYMTHHTMQKDIGEKSSATIAKAKKNLQDAGWINVTRRYQTCDLYEVKRVRKYFVMAPYDLLMLPDKLFHLYVYLLMICKDDITTRKIAKIKADLKIPDTRTLNKRIDQLVDYDLIILANINNKSAKNPDKKYVDTWQMVIVNHVIGKAQTMYFGKHYHVFNKALTMYLVKHNHVFRESELESIKKEYIEIEYAKGKSKAYLTHKPYLTNTNSYPTDINPDTYPEETNTNILPDINSDTYPDTDILPDTDITDTDTDILPDTDITDTDTDITDTDTDRAEDKESFVAGQDDDIDLNSMTTNELYAYVAKQDAAEPPKINRKILRDSKHKVSLSNSEFEKFKEAKKTKFNGDIDVVAKYIEHEIKMWDGSDRIIKGDKRLLLFQKEYYTNHEIFQHFINMTPEQRVMELSTAKK